MPHRSGTHEQAEQPLISVLMTVWNGETYLAEAVASVIAQETSARWELIIVDDGSTDRSGSIAQAFADRDQRISVLQHPEGANCGISASRNLAIQFATGHLLAFLDSDDVWLPYRLEHQLQKLQEWPEAAMIYGQAERWWDMNRPFDERDLCNGENHIPALIPPGENFGLLHGPTLLRWFLSDESFTPCTCSVMVKAEVARHVGGFEDSFRGLYDDQVFYAKVSLSNPVLADERCVARYRRHAASCCWLAEEQAESMIARCEFLRWLADYLETQEYETPFETVVIGRTRMSTYA